MNWEGCDDGLILKLCEDLNRGTEKNTKAIIGIGQHGTENTTRALRNMKQER
jgi:hypothetical protein